LSFSVLLKRKEEKTFSRYFFSLQTSTLTYKEEKVKDQRLGVKIFSLIQGGIKNISLNNMKNSGLTKV